MEYTKLDFVEFEENNFSKILRKKKSENAKLLNLIQSNPTEVELFFPSSKLFLNFPKYYEPNPSGNYKARNSLVEYFRKKNRIISEETIYFASGSSESLSYILKAITSVGDEILLPKPGYPLYEYVIELDSRKFQYYKMNYQLVEQNKLSWSLDKNSLLNSITKNTKAILLVEPNNPAGFILKEEDAIFISKIAIEKNLILIIDEVFSDYYPNYFEKNFFLPNNLIYLGGISKTSLLPQLKLSWIILSGNSTFIQEIKKALELIIDTYLTVNSISIDLLPSILDLSKEIQDLVSKRIQTNLNYLSKFKDKIHYIIPDGGWYILFKFLFEDDEELACKVLEEKNLILQPGYFFDLEGCFLIASLLTKENDFEEGINRLISFGKNL